MSRISHNAKHADIVTSGRNNRALSARAAAPMSSMRAIAPNEEPRVITVRQRGSQLSVLQTIADTYILPSPLHGLGLWAGVDIQEGDFLCALDGQRIRYEDYVALTSDPDSAPFMEWNALSDTLLLVRSFRTSYSFINHARRPNCYLEDAFDTLRIFAGEPIRRGAELTLDYRNEPLLEVYLSGHGATFL